MLQVVGVCANARAAADSGHHWATQDLDRKVNKSESSALEEWPHDQ